MHKRLSFIRLNIIETILFCLIIGIFYGNGLARTPQPAETFSLTFDSEGAKLYGRFYKAQAEAPTPVVLLLPGFTGSAGDLFGLGHKLSSAGIHAFFFNYRGTRESEGVFTPENSVQDAVNAIRFLKSDTVLRRFKIDTTRIMLTGHSWGGSAALLASLKFPSINIIVSIATTDFKIFAEKLEENEIFRKGHRAYLDKILSDTSLLRSMSGAKSHEWLIGHKRNYDLQARAAALSNKQILLIGGWQDLSAPVEIHLIPLYRALQKNDSKFSKIKVYDTGHGFRNVRDRITRDVLEWLRPTSPDQ